MPTPNPPVLTGRRCQCCGCGEYFNGERGFDRHRVGEYGVSRRCLSIDEMTALGWHRKASGFWAMTRLDSAGKARIRATRGTIAPSPHVEASGTNSRGPAGAL